MSTPSPDMLTLTVEGIVTDIAKKANRCFAYYLRSFHSQSTAYLGRVNSMSHDVQQYGSNPEEMTSAVKQSLESIYREHFDQVTIAVRTKRVSEYRPEYTLVISGTLSDGKNQFNLNKVLNFENGILADINEENNQNG